MLAPELKTCRSTSTLLVFVYTKALGEVGMGFIAQSELIRTHVVSALNLNPAPVADAHICYYLVISALSCLSGT